MIFLCKLDGPICVWKYKQINEKKSVSCVDLCALCLVVEKPHSTEVTLWLSESVRDMNVWLFWVEFFIIPEFLIWAIKKKSETNFLQVL